MVLFPPGASAPNSSYPGGYKAFRIPAIIAHPEGRLVLAFAEGRQFGCECSTTPTEICSKDLVLRRSHDGGATFEAMQVAVAATAIPGGDKRVGLRLCVRQAAAPLQPLTVYASDALSICRDNVRLANLETITTVSQGS